MTTMTYESAKRLLDIQGQGHVLKFWSTLDAAGKLGMLSQIASLDFDGVGRMQDILRSKGAPVVPGALQPAPVISLSGAEHAAAVREGESALKAGEVGVLLVAGGQGSRLGYDGPKGAFPVGPVSGAPLFSIHARKVLALSRRYGAALPLYIMTSQGNDRATRDFFAQHARFGLPEADVLFFPQGMWPALDKNGKIILSGPGEIFMSPDGHGGILRALQMGGMFEDMRKRGLRTLFFFQVDNPLVEVADPGFIGVHRLKNADISVKVCAKRDPDEGLGVVVEREGRQAVVEYTELTREQKDARQPDGELTFKYGSVAIHVFSLDFMIRETVAGLPLHVAHKKVPFCDEHGHQIKPDAPNAFKFEKFIFDVIPDAQRVVNVEFKREVEFSPVKNATGNDSPETCQRDMMLKCVRWLKACGVNVPLDAQGIPVNRIEIDPCYANSVEELKMKISPYLTIAVDTLFV